jgi:uncharacterized protein (DUF433 family)/DNA-binding transcriptional MerR regulator
MFYYERDGVKPIKKGGMTLTKGGEKIEVMAHPPRAIGHYTATEVGRLAGVSARRIGQWARYGIIPSVSKRPRVYSYADAGEAVLTRYLVEQKLRPRDVRTIVENLREEYGAWPLATAPLEHEGRFVVVKGKDGVYLSAYKPKQGVLAETLVDLKAVRTALARGGWVALENPREHIEVNPERLSGAPAVRGKRVATETVASLAARAAGRTVLKEDFELTDAEIEDAVGYEQAVREALAA